MTKTVIVIREKSQGCLGGCLGGIIKLTIAVVLLIGLIGLIANRGRVSVRPSPPSNATPPPPSVDPIKQFFDAHPELGTPIGHEDLPNWAQGKRLAANMSDGRRLLLYCKDGDVVTVYVDNPREKIWEDPDYAAAQSQPAAPALTDREKSLKQTSEKQKARAKAGAERRKQLDGM